MDWKEALAGLKDTLPQPEEEVGTQRAASGSDSADQVGSQRAASGEAASRTRKESLRVLIDRKQRKGKTATIVEGFICETDEDDARVAAIAKELKQKLGTGGSSRGGEILLQGDWRERAAAHLRLLGFQVKCV